MPSKIKDLSQKRAKFAYEKVQAVTHEDWASDFKSHVKDVPMMIKTNGLAAAYAFVYSKSNKLDYQNISSISQEWLKKQKVIPSESQYGFNSQLAELDRNQYRLAVREILALFTWLKRYAEGMIQNEK